MNRRSTSRETIGCLKFWFRGRTTKSGPQFLLQFGTHIVHDQETKLSGEEPNDDAEQKVEGQRNGEEDVAHDTDDVTPTQDVPEECEKKPSNKSISDEIENVENG